MPAIYRFLVVAALSAFALGCSTGSDETFELPGPADASSSTSIAPPTATIVVPPASTISSVIPEGPAASGQPVDVTTAQAIITSADGEVCEVCVWFANEADERARGLMQVTDLGDPVGMVFAYAEDTTGNFFMFNTPTPLSIAWFDREGAYLAETDMEPCLVDDPAVCTRYNPGVPYVIALEVFQGDLAGLGIGPGSTLQLVPGSESANCPAPS